MTLGTRYYPETDEIQIAFGPLDFAKKHRGKRVATPNSHEVPDKLTKTICFSKSAELFDVCGLAAPIMGGMKLDIRDLVNAKCDWNDRIPDSCREEWLKNFVLLEKIGELRYSRIVIPLDAESLCMEIIGTGDASEKMTCAVMVYVSPDISGFYLSEDAMLQLKIVPQNFPHICSAASVFSVECASRITLEG